MNNVQGEVYILSAEQHVEYRYRFLDALLPNVKWTIKSSSINEYAPPRGEQPALRWVKDSKVMELFTQPAMPTGMLLEELNLSLTGEKGGYTLSKRISRLIRPYKAAKWVETPNIVYRSDWNQKAWDGSGLVSRKYVKNFVEGMDPKTAKEILDCPRLEVTVLTTNGQDKAHCLVVDMEEDFMFPIDTKTATRALRGGAFVGIVPVHGKDKMRLDMQSLVNLGSVFPEDSLKRWFNQSTHDWVENLKRGQVMGLSDKDESWWLMDYLKRGGNPLWLKSSVKGYGNMKVAELEKMSAGKPRFPVPGGRYYIWPAEIGNVSVRPNHCYVDPKRATVWVNTEDWCTHIADILGGADGDDGCWCVPYSNGSETKFLVWRSPNQAGEYMALTAEEGSFIPKWSYMGVEEDLMFINEDLLPERIDKRDTKYARKLTGKGEGPSGYQINDMLEAASAAAGNAGALGAYCNILMVAEAIGWTFKELPYRLEDVIDATVKTGESVADVKDWVKAQAKLIAAARPVPQMLLNRMSGVKARTDRHHKLTNLLQHIKVVEDRVRQVVAELMEQAVAPAPLFSRNHTDEQLANARVIYGMFTRMRKDRVEWDIISERVGGALKTMAEPSEVMLTLLAQIQLKNLSDSMCFLKSTAPYTLKGLQGIGLIGEVVKTEGGRLMLEFNDFKAAQKLKIGGAWFAGVAGTYSSMSEVPADLRKQLKREVRLPEGRLTVEDGQVFDRLGILRGWSKSPDGQYQAIGHKVRDGNITATVLAI